MSLALLLGLLAQRFNLSPLVGYIFAGILAAQDWWGVPVNKVMIDHCSDFAVILLLFGVGLQFHFKDLVAVQKVAVPGALLCIALMVGAGTLAFSYFGMAAGWTPCVMYGLCICVSSTVVLTRVLADNHILSTAAGHTALGWLVVEDIFTILLLVLLPAVFGGGDLLREFLWMVLKLGVLVLVVGYAGRFFISKVLSRISRGNSNELFTLAVLVAALGIAVLSDRTFNASTEFGAFLSGMVLGQSKYAARAAGDALPMRDAFAVLFFLSIGMGFEIGGLVEHWHLALATLCACMLVKPLAAYFVIRIMGKSRRLAIKVAAALSQIGEFSFILAALMVERYHVLPHAAVNVITGVAIVSIFINASCYRFIPMLIDSLERRGVNLMPEPDSSNVPEPAEDVDRVIVVGYGPCGELVCDILRRNHFEVVVLEMNIDTVTHLAEQGIPAMYGDARLRSILSMAGVEMAHSIIVTAPAAPAKEIASAARSLNPNIRVLAHTAYIRNAHDLLQGGAEAAFSGEASAAVDMAAHLLTREGLTPEDAHRQGEVALRRIFGHTTAEDAEEEPA
ncbi:MAG: cation:proton antiporter [Akkermansia sp.]|nr:cation:proton antiporter [Akkermansia sp.]